MGFLLWIFLYSTILYFAGKALSYIYKCIKYKTLSVRDKKLNIFEKILLIPTSFIGVGIFFIAYANISYIVELAIFLSLIGGLILLDYFFPIHHPESINKNIFSKIRFPFTAFFTPYILYIAFLIFYNPEVGFLFGNNWKTSLSIFLVYSSLVTIITSIPCLYIAYSGLKIKMSWKLKAFFLGSFLGIIAFFSTTTYMTYQTLTNDVQYYEGTCRVDHEHYHRKSLRINNYSINLTDSPSKISRPISNALAAKLQNEKICESGRTVKAYYTWPLGGILTVEYNPNETNNKVPSIDDIRKLTNKDLNNEYEVVFNKLYKKEGNENGVYMTIPGVNELDSYEVSDDNNYVLVNANRKHFGAGKVFDRYIIDTRKKHLINLREKIIDSPTIAEIYYKNYTTRETFREQIEVAQIIEDKYVVFTLCVEFSSDPGVFLYNIENGAVAYFDNTISSSLEIGNDVFYFDHHRDLLVKNHQLFYYHLGHAFKLFDLGEYKDVISFDDYTTGDNFVLKVINTDSSISNLVINMKTGEILDLESALDKNWDYRSKYFARPTIRNIIEDSPDYKHPEYKIYLDKYLDKQEYWRYKINEKIFIYSPISTISKYD
ncbi:MAG: hypothetical protein U0525_00125 [Patescibacteria group bacterium]